MDRKNRRSTARMSTFLLCVVMLCSMFLTVACNATQTIEKAQNEGTRTNEDFSSTDPEKGTVEVDNSGYASTVELTAEQFANLAQAYIKQQSELENLAEYGISSDEYVWTIVTLEGDGLLKGYIEDKIEDSVSDYISTSGLGYSEYRNMLTRQAQVKREISAIDSDAAYSYSYTLVSNGFAAYVKAENIALIRALSGVKSVSISEQYYLPDDDSTEFYSSDSESGQNIEVADDEYMGQGTLIAVLDSALDLSHPAFSGEYMDESSLKADEDYISTVLKSTDAYYEQYYNNIGDSQVLEAEDVYRNNKIVFAYDYGNKDTGVAPLMMFGTTLEHGTHSAGIIAGYVEDEDGNVTFSGAAPQAQIAFMKVFYENTTDYVVSSSDTDIAAALEDAIILGVDSINMSLGAARGLSEDNSSENYIYLYCYYADLIGISVQASAGNSFTSSYDGVSGDYPTVDDIDYGSINSPASYESTLAIASYGGTNVLQYYAAFSNGANAFYTDPDEGETFIEALGEGTYEYFYVDEYSTLNELAQIFVQNNLKDKIVFVPYLTSIVTANEIMAYAMYSGAKAVVYVDDSYYATRTVSCTVEDAIPYCGMSLMDAEKFSDNKTGTLTLSTSQIQYNLMSEFSSWGTLESLSLKPEIAGIGGNVYSSILSSSYWGSYASYYGIDEDEMDYAYMSGTSMAAPYITAYVTRLRQYYSQLYPELSERDLKTLVNRIVMSTATQLVDVNGNTYSPRYQGAGALDYEAAKNTPAYISVTGTQKTKIELGEDPDKTGVYTLVFNIVNMSSSELNYKYNLEVLTDSVCKDGKTISLTSHSLEASTRRISVSGDGWYDGDVITVSANGTVSVALQFTLNDSDREYLAVFPDGAYIEGYVSLAETTDGGKLSVPYLAFYGDWEKSAMLDKSVYDDEEASRFATRIVATTYYGNSVAYLGQYQYVVPDGYEDIDWDANRLAIGSQTGGYLGLYQFYVGLLRNTSSIEYNISNVETGQVYTQYATDAIGKAGYIESAGQMYPAIQEVKFGSSLPNNTMLRVSIRATMATMGDTENDYDTQEFIIAVDSESPKMFKDSKGVYTENGRTYLQIHAYDNYYLSCYWLYYYDENGEATSFDAPFPVDTSTWNPMGNDNYLTVDITDYLDILGSSSVIGIILEDAAQNRSYYSVSATALQDAPNDSSDTTEYEYYTLVNVAVDCSTDFGIDSDIDYELEVVTPDENGHIDGSEQIYVGKVEIDSANKLAVARGAGLARVKITFPNAESVYSDVFVYAQSGGYTFVANSYANWVKKYTPDGGVEKDEKYDDSSYYMIYYYNGSGTHIEIPSEYVGEDGVVHEIVSVYPYAFQYCSDLIEVTVPDSIVAINTDAFHGCTSLQRINFGENSKLNAIQSFAFAYCYSLESVALPASLNYLGSGAFDECTSLTTVTFGNNSLDSHLYTIGSYAFSNTQLSEVIIPESVTSIGSAFAGCPLKEIELPEGMTESGSFRGCTELETVKLSPNTKSIQMSAFNGCTSLKNIEIPSGVEKIGASAFYNCQSLTSVVLPDAVESIGANAFAYCTRLMRVEFGDSLNTIGNNAFIYDTALSVVYFDQQTEITSMGTDVFYGCSNFTEFAVHPSNSAYMVDDGILYKTIENGDAINYELYMVPISKQVTQLNLRPDVLEISDYAFAYHTELLYVNIPANSVVTTIGNYAFAGCTSLEIINLQNASKLTSLGTYCFYYDIALTSISFPSSLKTIPQYAFAYCVYLKTIGLTDSLQKINNQAFVYCIRLEGNAENKTLELPASVSSVGGGAFAYCRMLKKVDMSKTDVVLGSQTFYYCSALEEVVLSDKQEEIPDSCFMYCTSLKKVNLGSSMESIGIRAFAYCTSLESVEFPESLTAVKNYAFFGCGLKEAIFPEGSCSIYSYAFALCESLQTLVLPSTISEINAYSFAQTALREVKIPSSVGRYDLNETAFYYCLDMEKYIVDDDNPYFGVTDEGILYVKSFETLTSVNGTYETVVVSDTMLLVPQNLRLKELRIGDNFTDLSSSLFMNVQGIEKIYIPASVTTISSYAFYSCGVKEVEFAADSPLIFDATSDYAIFYNCTQLETVILPSKLTCIPPYMFYNCTALKNIVIPESVTTIYYYAFTGSGITEIDLSNVTEVQSSAFAYCEDLTAVIIGRETEIDFSSGYTAFEGCNSIETITCSDVNKLYKVIDGVLFDKTGAILYLYPNGSAATEYTVPSGVTKIGECAFAFNRNLQKIVLPATLENIGSYAFYQTENLTDYVFLGKTAPAFEGVYSSSYATVLYGNIYDYYFNDFDIIVTMERPADGTGYDNWLFSYFFYNQSDLSQNYQSPSQAIAVPDEEIVVSSDETITDYVQEFRDYIDEAEESTTDSITCDSLEELYEEFVSKYETLCNLGMLGGENYSYDFRTRFLNDYCKEADRILAYSTEAYTLRWEKLYALIDVVNELLEVNGDVYSDENREHLTSIVESARVAILSCDTAEEIDETYEYYVASATSIPTVVTQSNFDEAVAAAKEQITAQFKAAIGLPQDQDIYSTDETESSEYENGLTFSFENNEYYSAGALEYLYEKYEIAISGADSAYSTTGLESVVSSWESTLENTVKKSNEEEFNQRKAEQLARFDKYNEDDYLPYLWQYYFVPTFELAESNIETYYDITEIIAEMDAAIAYCDTGETYFQSEQDDAADYIEGLVLSYNMYVNLYDEQAKVLQNIVAEVLEDLENATNLEELHNAKDEGFDRIFTYYAYHQKAYTEYRNALAAFEKLSGEQKEEALDRLSQISYLVATNADAIIELVNEYCGE